MMTRSDAIGTSGHFAAEFQCPLLGLKRTLDGHSDMSAFDPKRTSSVDCGLGWHHLGGPQDDGTGESLPPPGQLARLIEMSVAAHRCAHQEAIAFLDDALDIVRFHMRVADDDVGLLTGIDD